MLDTRHAVGVERAEGELRRGTRRRSSPFGRAKPRRRA